ncbi:DUF4261 domain-containing protein [Metasolibacillus meyeri]|uniref:DUF4261 domain-containing protein n=1 Tax=Metasolibacillus meyeri TaxID=1071052 RepID=A0AAW9NYI4_9BACL|nr:DUF4261 domain-containing protein [Metasolibacillus meyeri]MEC1180070.1 DUF4261 domain-containing protein [Metasolibacillus meyeri]
MESNEKHQGGAFVSFVLLDQVEFSFKQLAADLQKDWGITLEDTDIDNEQQSLICTIDGILATVSLMPAPVPNDEAIQNAHTNFHWSEAVAVAEAHQAHLLIAMLPHDQSSIDTGILMVKICASALKQPTATGINTLGSVLAPDFYIHYAHTSLQEGDFPIMNLVFFGLYSRDEGKTICSYTYGLRNFGKMEMEVLDSEQEIGSILELLVDISSYVITSDVRLRDGETIGFTEEQKLSISFSPAYAIDGESLKIGF